MKNYSTLKIDGFDGHLVLYCKNHYNVKNIDLITGFQRMWAVRCGYGIECIDKGSLEHIADRLFKILSQTNGFDSVHFLKRLHNEVSKTYLNRYEGLTPIEILIYFYASEIMQLQVYDTKSKITFIELPKPKKRLFNRILKGNWEFDDYKLIQK